MVNSNEAHYTFAKFGWSSNPFSLKVDPDVFVGYEEQTKKIKDFVDNEERLALILGPTGSGKTTMLRWLERNLWRPGRKIFYLAKPPKDLKEFRSIFLEYFPLSFFERIFFKKPSIYSLYKYVNKKLRGNHLILLLDESHETVVDVLEWLRVFVDQIDRISLIMAALPEFENILKEKLKTFYERISVKVELKALSKTETYLMIKKRIEKVGGKGIEPFTEEAIDKIYEITGGFPREVLKVCSKAVEYILSLGMEKVTSEVIEEITIPTKRRGEDIFELVENLTSKQKKILEIIATRGPMTTAEILKYIDLKIYKSRSHALRSINNILKKLMELGLIDRRREGTKYIYFAVPKVETLFVNR